MKKTICIFTILMSTALFSQNETSEIPYYEIPAYSDTYTAGTVAARQVDALGFRFYWASEGLTEKDLIYKPNDSVRTTGETVNHIYDLSIIILNATLKKTNADEADDNYAFEEKRKQILINLKTAAEILRASDDISQFKIIFGEREIPFWNNINGPIADAIWHSGQIASFRRTTGNPINPNISHFSGTVKNL
ncbi:hypothetical protein OAD62_06885 [Oceanihabitans sp.]|nr:hypothetical protein [Oceanihabitans sp.]